MLRNAVEAVLYRPVVGRWLLLPMARWGFRRFERTGMTPRPAYAAMRKLYGNEDASLYEQLVEDTRAPSNPSSSSGEGPLEGIAASEIDSVVDRLRLDGYAILEARLDAARCGALEAGARQASCRMVGPDGTRPGRGTFDEAHPTALRYDLDEGDILDIPAAQELVADRSLFEIARRYLGVEPVQDLVAMWWSAAVRSSDRGAADAAQQFHFDLDRLRFLKVFVFLTDVDEANGPHVYVRGTHRGAPPRFRSDGRHCDDEVLPAFADDVCSISGPRGTVFLADTRGLHKGRALEEGHRLVFQTEYATSLFGNSYTRPRIGDPVPSLLALAAEHPAAFARFDLNVGATASG